MKRTKKKVLKKELKKVLKPTAKKYPVTKAGLRKALEDFDFPLVSRPNVLDKKYNGFVLGRVNLRPLNRPSPNVKTALSKKTQSSKYLPLFKLASAVLKKYKPSAKFTSIQFNKNAKMKKHKDTYNKTASYIIGLGDYTGGDLILYDEQGKNPKRINIKNKFVNFNGAVRPHEVAPFKGNRYTLVYYSI